jgi:hypothetical protein
MNESSWHVPGPVLRRYAESTALSPAQATSVEAHLDDCAGCRGRLVSSADVDLLDRIGLDLFEQAERTPQYRRPRWWRIRFTAGLPAAWVLAVLAVSVTSGALDLLGEAGGSGRPSLLLLLAPVLPLMAVAGSWTPRIDPMHDLTASTPSAGLLLLLRRSVIVLAAVVLLSLVLSAVVAAFGVAVSPAQWLLPALALAAGSLALGSVVPLHRAAIGLAGTWVLAVVLPSMTAAQTPLVLRTSATPVWAAVLVVALAVVAGRRRTYQHFTPTP